MQSRMSCILKNKKTNPKQNKKTPAIKNSIFFGIYNMVKKKKKRKNEVQHIKPLIHSIAKTEAFTVSLWESSYTSLQLICP